MSASIAIVGAGIAGLTAAHRLKRRGLRPVLFEAEQQAGGRMISETRGDFHFDLGTIALMGGSALPKELIDAAGLSAHFAKAEGLIGAIVQNGRAKRLDFGHPLRDIVATDLFSTRAKLALARIGIDVARYGSRFNCVDAVGLGELDTQTAQQYAEARLGRELADYLCNPLMRAIWVASARRNSVVQLLWTLKQMIHPLYGLATGNGSLALALARQHEVRYRHCVLVVEDAGGSGVRLQYESPAGPGSDEFDAAIIAVPPPLALKMRAAAPGAQRQFFEAIRFNRGLAAHFGLSRRPPNPETMLMFPEAETQDAAVVYVNHNKAPGRAPVGKGSISLYFTDSWSGLHFDDSDEQVLQIARERLEPHFGPFDGLIEQAFVHRWPVFLMEAHPGMYRLMDDYDRWLKSSAPERVQFAGDFMPNPGVNQAMESGNAAAGRVMRYLNLPVS